MRWLPLVAISLVLATVVAKELLPYDPMADQSAVVTSGKARFTVLTPQLIRLEYNDKAAFENRATFAVVNRKLAVPHFTHSTTNNVLEIKTDALTLSYQVGSAFSASTLSISPVKSGTDAFKKWSYGMTNSGSRNLLGTIKSLDEIGAETLNCTENAGKMVHDEHFHCEWGLVSRDGWALLDDADNWGLDSDFWWQSLNSDSVDLYFFGHGLNFKQALTDYQKIGGKVPMIPRHAMGIWWSIWLNVNNYDVVEIVENYERYGFPLDTYILDMDWHTKQGWGGYSFDRRLFPEPADTLGWLHEKGLYTGANLHDNDGVRSTEDKYKEMAKALGMNPNGTATIPFKVVSKEYMHALEDIVLKHNENMGMDFWWIDWQQGEKQGGCAGGKQNPTIGLNQVRVTDHLRRGENKRGLVLARWGGMGNHRYQVGFSGDVAGLTWANLAYQPYFSLTASNVLYGLWSHDIVGPSNDHELHTRWIQWGAMSPVFRTHDRGMSAGGCMNNNPPNCGIVAPWKVPYKYIGINREAYMLRESLLPYIYTGVREAFDSGVSLIRPMYYEFPQFDKAYLADSSGNFAQYFLFDDIIVAPVVTPANKTTQLAQKSVWLPPGQWFDLNTQTMRTGASDGSTVLTKGYDLSEIPMFAKAGSIIRARNVPYGSIGLASRQYTDLEFFVNPGSSSGHCQLYEDDGMSRDYLDNKHVFTTLTYTRTSDSLTFTISGVGSSSPYPSFPSKRQYTLKIVNFLPLKSGTINGAAITAGATGANTWSYDGDRLTTVIRTGMVSTSSDVTIKVSAIAAVDDTLMSGLAGKLIHANLAKKNLDETRVTPGAHSVSGGRISDAASAGKLMGYQALKDSQAFMTTLKGYNAMYTAAVDEINALKPSKSARNSDAAFAINYNRWSYSMALLESAMK